jgi:hypothetical protein
MGTEQAGKWKHLYLCLAGLILSACAATQEVQKPENKQEELLVAQQFLARGEFDKAMAESQRSLSAEGSPSSKGAALFTLGLIYAHPGNSGKDSASAIGFFKRVISETPGSHWAAQARIWIALLQENDDLRQSNTIFQEKLTGLGQAHEELTREHENTAQGLKKLREENEALQQVIKKMKQVDIEIEERKKREGKVKEK